MCPPLSKLTDPATIQGTQSKSEPCVFSWITIHTRTEWISLYGCVSIVCVKEQSHRNSVLFSLVTGTLTDIPFLHAGSQWEYRWQVGVHAQSGNRVARIPFVPDGCSWTLGDRSYCECRVLVVFPSARCDGLRRNIFSSELPSSYMQGVADEKQFVVELHGNVHIDLFQNNGDGLCSIGQFEDRRHWLTWTTSVVQSESFWQQLDGFLLHLMPRIYPNPFAMPWLSL